MKHLSLLALFIVFFVTFAHSSEAAVTYRPFWGQLYYPKATELQTKEKTNNCVVPGSTIELNKSQGNSNPTSYFYSYDTHSKTNYKTQSDQWILGLYSDTRQTITCNLKTTPFTASTITFPTLYLFGTSKY